MLASYGCMAVVHDKILNAVQGAAGMYWGGSRPMGARPRLAELVRPLRS